MKKRMILIGMDIHYSRVENDEYTVWNIGRIEMMCEEDKAFGGRCAESRIIILDNFVYLGKFSGIVA